jgi:hypothetical protein
MAGPAFQLHDGGAVTGEYGTSPYGQEPYGGSASTPYMLPALQVPSDDLSAEHQRYVGRVVHRRYGIPVGSRVAYSQRRWHVNLEAVTEDVINALRSFSEAGSFRLLPDADQDDYITVMWSKNEFAPKRLRGPLWSITFEIEEVV